MNKLLSLSVVQLRVFRVDEIPFSSLQLESSTQKIQKAFGFKQTGPINTLFIAEVAGGIAFRAGEFPSGSTTTVVDQIIIEPRRILISVSGSSETADQVFAHLREVMREIDQRSERPALEPLVLTQETTTIMQLDFPITALVAGTPLEAFQTGVNSLIDSQGSRVRIYPSSIHFRVSYDDLPESLKASNITLADKDIGVEIRAGTAVQERTFFITSPNPSSKHIDLVSLFEKTFRSVTGITREA
jgi:hypothetical protein